MPFDLPHWFIFFSGICLSAYGTTRFPQYLRDRSNVVAYHLSMAMTLSGLGIGLFGLLSIFPGPHLAHISFATALTAGLENLGYVHFIAIPLYIFLPKHRYRTSKYLLFFGVVILTMLGILFRPDESAIFSDLLPTVALGSIVLQETALLSNALLMLRNFRKLRRLSFLNTAGLIIAYLFSAPSGSYFYIGNDPLLLKVSGVGLLVGVAFLLISALVQQQMPPSEERPALAT